MKKTLLEMVQDILSEMDSDEVNSINDTVEAEQVATIIKNCYFGMVSNRNWGDEKRLITLDHVGDTRKPTYLRIPDNVKQFDYLAYDCQREGSVDSANDYLTLKYKAPDEFLRLVQNRPKNNNKYVEVQDFGGSNLYIRKDANPQYWTSFDDEFIVCDSYNAELDDVLKPSKTQALVVTFPRWEFSDNFVPKLPVEGFSALYEDAKSTAFLELKQMANEKAEANARRQHRWLSRKNSNTMGGVRYMTFGRRSVK